MAQCKDENLAWQDVGARNRADFANGCRDDWTRVASDLTASDLRVALDVCEETARALDGYSCAEVIALYAPIE